MESPLINDNEVNLWKKLVLNTSAMSPVPPPPDFNPLNEPNLLFWFDSKENVTVGVGNTVTAWTDLSPFANSITQPTAEARPVLIEAASPNGSPAIVFDGVDDFLRLTIAGSATPRTTYLLMAVNSVADGAHLFDGSSSNHFIFNDSANLNYKAVATRPRPGDLQFFFVCLKDTDSPDVGMSFFQINALSTEASPGDVNWDGFTIGMSRAPFNTANSNISVCAILQYDAIHDGVKVAQFFAYLAARFGTGT